MIYGHFQNKELNSEKKMTFFLLFTIRMRKLEYFIPVFVTKFVPSPNFQKNNKSYYENNSFGPSGYFHRKFGQDVILVPTSPHFALQNAPKSGRGGVLGPLGAVLGASWAVLEAF